MRPDPSDIIARKRVRYAQKRNMPRMQPLRTFKIRNILPLLGGILFLSGFIFSPISFRDILMHIDKPITKIKIENQWVYVNDKEIKSLLKSRMGMGIGFFRFDIKGLKHDLEGLPWVDEASISRLWPDSLSLHLKEQVAIAYWNREGLLNSKGEVFRPEYANEVVGAPNLFGPEGSQIRVMEQYQLFSKLLLPSGLRLSGLELSERGSWSLTVNKSMRIVAGRAKLIDRLERFIKLYERDDLSKNFRNSEVDLRYENGIAVKSIETELSELAYR